MLLKLSLRFYIITSILLVGCADKKAPDPIRLYYIREDIHDFGKLDTVSYAEFPQKDTTDQFIVKDEFMFDKCTHHVCAYTSTNHAPIDGGRLYYTLDSLGVIYCKRTTWFTCVRLYSNNDSLNNLISQTLAHILMNPKLHCYGCTLIDATSRESIPSANP